jgi:hypothetical protein
MNWDYTRTKVTVDPKDPTVFQVQLGNNGALPVTFALTKVEPASPIKTIEERLRLITVSMVTRRSTVNPGEAVKFKLKLQAPLSELPQKGQVNLTFLDPQHNVGISFWALRKALTTGLYDGATDYDELLEAIKQNAPRRKATP